MMFGASPGSPSGGMHFWLDAAPRRAFAVACLSVQPSIVE